MDAKHYAVSTSRAILARQAVSRCFLAVLLAIVSSCALADWTDPERLQGLTHHARKAPASAERSVQELADYLVRAAQDDYEKTYVLFRWVTLNIRHEVKALPSEPARNQYPGIVLHRRRSQSSGYAQLMAALGAAAGLDIRQISGFAKGTAYTPGQAMNGASNHSWNAVHIEGQWYLLDASWAAGWIKNKKRFVRRYNDFFFLTPPAQLIYSHLPRDERWQLLAQPVSSEQFVAMPCLQPAFFRHGITLVSHHSLSISSDGTLAIRLDARPDTLISARLKGDKHPSSGWRTQVHTTHGQTTIHVALPRRGSYELQIFAVGKNRNRRHDYVMSYRIGATQGAGVTADVLAARATSTPSRTGVTMASPRQVQTSFSTAVYTLLP